MEFYKEAIKRFDDDESIPALFDDTMVNISTKLSTLSMGDEYKSYVQVRFLSLMAAIPDVDHGRPFKPTPDSPFSSPIWRNILLSIWHSQLLALRNTRYWVLSSGYHLYNPRSSAVTSLDRERWIRLELRMPKIR